MRVQFTTGHYVYLVETLFTHNSDDCLLWPYGKDKDGYGKIGIYFKHYRVHRVAYSLFNSKPCINLACHTCDHPSCYNGRHLFDGTHLQNFADMKAKDRSCRGERQHLSRFTNDKILTFRQEFSEHGSITKISTKYGVPVSTIEKIVSRQTWKHI